MYTAPYLELWFWIPKRFQKSKQNQIVAGFIECFSNTATIIKNIFTIIALQPNLGVVSVNFVP